MKNVQVNESLDRVTVSVNRKLNLGNFSSIDIFMSYSSDVTIKETPEMAGERVFNVVETILKDKIKKAAKEELV